MTFTDALLLLNAVFTPVFVALGPLTVVPLFLGMTQGLDGPRRKAVAQRGLVTAFVVAVLITIGGRALFRLLGITVHDLRIAGGLILLLIAVYDLVYSREERKQADVANLDTAVVPLGVPLIAGPGTISTCLVLADAYGIGWVLVSLVLNIGILAALLLNAERVLHLVGPGVVRAFGKVMSLFLAAIAVSMIRTGIEALFTTTGAG